MNCVPGALVFVIHAHESATDPIKEAPLARIQFPGQEHFDRGFDDGAHVIEIRQLLPFVLVVIPCVEKMSRKKVLGTWPGSVLDRSTKAIASGSQCQ